MMYVETTPSILKKRRNKINQYKNNISMSNIKIFENNQFGQIRTAGTSENPLFCLADICKVLELKTNDVKNRLKKDGVDSIGVILDKERNRKVQDRTHKSGQ